MIRDQRQIEIAASPEEVFDAIAVMPNKFPIYRIFETRPFFFLRILLVDGLRSAVRTMGEGVPEVATMLRVGDSMGPFTLSESERPRRYWFTLRSFFFNCGTGYVIAKEGDATVLHFDTVAEHPTLMERVWWFLTKPVHVLFANKVLRVIKERVESGSNARVVS